MNGFRLALALLPTLTLLPQGPSAPPSGRVQLASKLAACSSYSTPPWMVLIQPGTFQMGSDAAEGPPYYNHPWSQPVHSVTLTYCFWMGKTEVTQAQYTALMGTNPSAFYLGPTLPVFNVTWYDARAYCAALTARQSARGKVPQGYEFRLPTEAEWEYACRAGTTTEFNVGASLFCDQAKFRWSWHSSSGCPDNHPVPVGSYAPNAWGLHDMHGSMEEWCLDSYADYPAAPATDPFVTGGRYRISRGGSLSDNSDGCRSASRNYADPPSYTHMGQGFRVVLAPIRDP